MSMQFDVGQTININLNGKVRKFVYEGFEQSSELHKLKSFDEIVYMDDHYLSSLLVSSRHPSFIEKSINNFLELFTLDAHPRVS